MAGKFSVIQTTAIRYLWKNTTGRSENSACPWCFEGVKEKLENLIYQGKLWKGN